LGRVSWRTVRKQIAVSSAGALSNARAARLRVIAVVAPLAERLEVVVRTVRWIVVKMRYGQHDFDHLDEMSVRRARHVKRWAQIPRVTQWSFADFVKRAAPVAIAPRAITHAASFAPLASAGADAL
jgi:broad specificity phosphatase PhoE